MSLVGHSKNIDSYFEAKGEPLQCFEREVLWSRQHFSSVTLMAVLRIDCKGRSRDRLGGCCKSPDKRWWWEMVRFWLCVEGRVKGICWWGGEEMRRWGKKSKRWHPGFWSELGLELQLRPAPCFFCVLQLFIACSLISFTVQNYPNFSCDRHSICHIVYFFIYF